jgi:hypothetical protein
MQTIPAGLAAGIAVFVHITPAHADDVVVRFDKNTILYVEPSGDAERAGIIGKGARAIRKHTALSSGTGCESGRWIEIEPRGWACETSAAITTERPSAAVNARFALHDESYDDRLVPGVYATVRGKNIQAFDSREDAVAGNGRALVGSNSVRLSGSVTVDGKRYLRTSRGDLIESTAIRRFSPSTFRGIAIDDGDEMPAWIRSHDRPREPVVARDAPSPRGRRIAELAPRTVVTIHETSADRRFVRISDREWVSRRDVRVATLADPPPGTNPDEKWFDVDLDEQVVVAYEGTRPVYATLVSTGKRKHRTPTRITRIASKLVRATMNSDTDGDEVYSVADVPWTMYYDDNGYALHTSYWHDGFGGPRSHGCINLAPRDARALFYWSSPDVPPGWIAVYGDECNPGSLVRVRSSGDRLPAFRGYARRLREKQQEQKQPPQQARRI